MYNKDTLKLSVTQMSLYTWKIELTLYFRKKLLCKDIYYCGTLGKKKKKMSRIHQNTIAPYLWGM